ncbi:unnamed protein product [Vitrella brassicaformis CCMP3155]|uniref:Uncharacterized protein n=1 Tax=Vitrella brassicaformis (strain CCMP3155) TaxID=1169540 RepID=A0A0G4ECH7_VITBC|nr:unnamed protein product [Vitrella brassicaformis CCMP3155]|eukprot:CEL93435.1 unnamed protein product [Vitrella brassicaformis CCMP3155]
MLGEVIAGRSAAVQGELTPTEPASPYEPTAPLVDPAMPPQQDANPSPPVASSSATSPPQDAAPKAAAAPKQAPRKQVLICLGDYPTHLDMNSHPGSVGSPRKQRRRHPKAVTKRQEIFEFANSSSSSGANPSKKREGGDKDKYQVDVDFGKHGDKKEEDHSAGTVQTASCVEFLKYYTTHGGPGGKTPLQRWEEKHGGGGGGRSGGRGRGGGRSRCRSWRSCRGGGRTLAVTESVRSPRSTSRAGCTTRRGSGGLSREGEEGGV